VGEPIQSESAHSYQAQSAALDEHCGKCCHDASDTMPPPARVPRELRSTKPAESSADMVHSPPHYTRLTPEPLDVIEMWRCGFHVGNVIKYLARAGHKGDRLEDLRKARQYLDRLIRLEERKA